MSLDARHHCREKGFSLLELIFVIIIIAFLLFIGSEVYLSEIENSKRETLLFQANTFSRTINNLRATALIHQSKSVDLDNKKIYLNEKGWPANTKVNLSAKSWDQTSEECQQLWFALYERPPESILNINEKKSSSLYFISSINGRICRYELLRKEEGAYFFDYHLDTGEIKTSIEN